MVPFITGPLQALLQVYVSMIRVLVTLLAVPLRGAEPFETATRTRPPESWKQKAKVVPDRVSVKVPFPPIELVRYGERYGSADVAATLGQRPCKYWPVERNRTRSQSK